MLEVFLCFRLSYIIDSDTRVPVAVASFEHRDEAAEYVKEHGGFMVPVLVSPTSDLRRGDSNVMMRSEMGNRS